MSQHFTGATPAQRAVEELGLILTATKWWNQDGKKQTVCPLPSYVVYGSKCKSSPNSRGKSLQLRLEKDNIQERKETKHTGKTKIKTCYALLGWYSRETSSFLKRKGGGDLGERGGAAERSGEGELRLGAM